MVPALVRGIYRALRPTFLYWMKTEVQAYSAQNFTVTRPDMSRSGFYQSGNQYQV